MAFSEVDGYQAVQYCFPLHNSSCVKEVRSIAENILMHLFFFSVSAFTVFVNLLVIISISHFKQLHTPTNLLILSLAVADLLVGIVVIPVEAIKVIESCWYLGETMCSVFHGIVFSVIFASLYNLVIIAVDRYVAVCDPLLYISKITIGKTLTSIFLTWIFSFIYNLVILYCNGQWYRSQANKNCHGECVLIISFTWGIVDLFVSFVAPCSVIICLYMKIFKVARIQVKVMNITTRIKMSESKATKTLGVVLSVFLVGWITYHVGSLTEDYRAHSDVIITFLSWIVYIHSFLNPLIYALFYPWFKTAVRHILTLHILAPSSSLINLLPENC
ncbi:trace amine-associated receptor 13c-like [Salvelinus sp. IW2-2015]|uniref:trace amine-associated receptor 13c-like n=1 Tax=Salvelinus sp. IW2-2015 TaxID=2691554 RepID=UPI000CDFC16E|nr:trace amine-associated receptor 13c-like [Salvelinus alpinus]